MAPAASATALAEDLAPAADGVTAAQAAEDRVDDLPNKAAEPAPWPRRPADNDDDAPRRASRTWILKRNKTNPRKTGTPPTRRCSRPTRRAPNKDGPRHRGRGRGERRRKRPRWVWGTSAGVSKPKQDQEEQEDVKITEDDLEAVVDELSDGEGDEEGAEQQRAKEERKPEREEMAPDVARVRDGFGGQDAVAARSGSTTSLVAGCVRAEGGQKLSSRRIVTTRSRKLRAGSDDEEEEDRGRGRRGARPRCFDLPGAQEPPLGDRLRRKQEPPSPRASPSPRTRPKLLRLDRMCGDFAASEVASQGTAAVRS